MKWTFLFVVLYDFVNYSTMNLDDYAKDRRISSESTGLNPSLGLYRTSYTHLGTVPY
jgi:hypothetical protein